MGFEPRRLLSARPRPLRARRSAHRLDRLPEGRRGSGRHGGGSAFAGACRHCWRGGNAEPENGAKAGRSGATVGRHRASSAAASFQILEGGLWSERGCGHPLARERSANCRSGSLLPSSCPSPARGEGTALQRARLAPSPNRIRLRMRSRWAANTPRRVRPGEGWGEGELRTRPRPALLAARPRILPQRQTGIVDCGGVGWLRRRRH